MGDSRRPNSTESRSTSHHLSSSALNIAPSRKARSADPTLNNNTASATARPPSCSPPVLSRQGTVRRLSHSLAQDSARRNSILVEPDPIPIPGVEFTPPSSYPTVFAPQTERRNSRASSVYDPEARRQSISASLFSIGSAIMNNSWQQGVSTTSSVAGSDCDYESPAGAATTATSPISISTTSQMAGIGGVLSPTLVAEERPRTSDSASSQGIRVVRPSRAGLSAGPRRVSSVHGSGTASPGGSERGGTASGDARTVEAKKPNLGIIGVCALDSKARSKPSRNILNRINAEQEFEIIIFGDKVILDEKPENWPICDYLISFYSDGFPLDKAVEYVRLRKPFSINDLPMQVVLWDRRLCLQVLDRYEVPTPKRVEVNRDGGPTLPTPEIAQHIFERSGIRLPGREDGTGGGMKPPNEVIMVNEDTISVDGVELRKPFVEKPVSGEDHNVYIYYSSEVGGGGRRLFRKINNKSSEADETLSTPRSITDQSSSYIYESFLSTQNHEDVKAYTVGLEYCHAETRKSPVVDGIVKRNTHGKEVRYITALGPEETKIARRVAEAFGQRVCGFDLLRVNDKSFVIDVNGWSFVKDNNDYYDKCAQILKQGFIEEKQRKETRFALEGENNGSKSSHFAALKSMLKSPSMVRLAGNPNGRGFHSPGDTSPITSPLASERPLSSKGLPPAASQADLLPPPAHPQLQGSSADMTEVDEEEEKPIPPPATKAQWKLKGMVAVIRHADRTPKQKFKFTFHTKPFVDLLKGHREEVLLIGEAALNSVMDAVDAAFQEGEEDAEKLKLLRTSLAKKGAWAGTKVQIKPMFRKKKNTEELTREFSHEPSSSYEPHHLDSNMRNNSRTGVTLSRVAAAEDNLEIEKLQLIIKWGGEPTHSARYQAQELGENMRNDLLLMNRDAIDDLKVFSSSERRVTTSANIWTTAFVNKQELPADFIKVRKDLLDDSNAAKDEMDKVKKKLKTLLRKGNPAPSQFAWPDNMPEPYIIARSVVELMKFHRRVMRQNFSKLYGGAASSLAAAVKGSAGTGTSSGPPSALTQAQNVTSVQARWCCGEDQELFKERWEKLFAEFNDSEKIDPGKISELHDTIKFDALHNRQFLEWVFTPSPEMLQEFNTLESDAARTMAAASDKNAEPPAEPVPIPTKSWPVEKGADKTADKMPDKASDKPKIAQRLGLRKKAVDPVTLQSSAINPAAESYFNLFTGMPRSNAKTDIRLEKLRELFLYSKILFDFIGPQEYGIKDSEKLEIGLLTSLPLLKAIVQDLVEMQASEDAKTSVYFTKESHIYTLLNCIIEGGIKTKIERNKIPELDYLSTICFELYESQNSTGEDENDEFNYSIRITISPGCHTFEPLDV